jgi:hypothetical protein
VALGGRGHNPSASLVLRFEVPQQACVRSTVRPSYSTLNDRDHRTLPPLHPARSSRGTVYTEFSAMRQCINATPPQPEVTLVRYVVMAEWQEPNGQRVLTRLVGDHAPAWVAKGYLHEGLYASWPLDSVRHNPGHSGSWMTIQRDGTAKSDERSRS